jgi:phosphohistidine phosphatase
MKSLLLMRHAKSDWAAPHQGDHERPLNERGVRSARIVGRFLAGQGQAPHYVFSSTAVRARTTAELALEAGGWAADIVLESDLYSSGPDGVIGVVSTAPAVERLLVVGHQPTWSLLVFELTGAGVDMKTATVAVIELDIAGWPDISGPRGVLADVINPRDHFGSEYDS